MFCSELLCMWYSGGTAVNKKRVVGDQVWTRSGQGLDKVTHSKENTPSSRETSSTSISKGSFTLCILRLHLKIVLHRHQWKCSHLRKTHSVNTSIDCHITHFKNAVAIRKKHIVWMDLKHLSFPYMISLNSVTIMFKKLSKNFCTWTCYYLHEIFIINVPMRIYIIHVDF